MANPVPVHRLTLADMHLPEWHPQAGEGCIVYAYLVVHPDGPILVDTGVGAGHPAIDAMYKPRVFPLESALAEHAVAVGDVIAVVNTHLHFDHCGNNGLFPGVPIYVQREEYEAARAPLYTVREWVDFPGCTYELVDGACEIATGVTLMPTPGHTPGHQSVLVQAEADATLICGQAAYTADEFTSGRDTGNVHEGLHEQYTRSLQRLHEQATERVLFSHDDTVVESVQ